MITAAETGGLLDTAKSFNSALIHCMQPCKNTMCSEVIFVCVCVSMHLQSAYVEYESLVPLFD